MIKTALLAVILTAGVIFAIWWARDTRASGSRGAWPSFAHVVIGFVTNFFDTLGIGSFATTTTAYKMLGLVPDERIPGTMIIGHGLPVVAQALIFIAVVQVDSMVLLSLIVATLLGGFVGASVVSKLPRRPIQAGMGVALLSAALFMTMGLLGLFPAGGTATGLPPGPLLLAVVVNVVLGALLMLGIGNYGPCLVLLSLLGMDPRAAFPVMMGAGALVAMVGGGRFVSTGRYDRQAALGLTAGGIPAVLVAAFLVKSLPMNSLRWMVVAVVVYTAFIMLRSAFAAREIE